MDLRPLPERMCHQRPYPHIGRGERQRESEREREREREKRQFKSARTLKVGSMSHKCPRQQPAQTQGNGV